MRLARAKPQSISERALATIVQRHRYRPGSYGLAALDAEVAALAAVAPGSRNHALNLASFRLFQLVAGGELDGNVVAHRLLDACHRNGLIADDGLARCWLPSAAAAAPDRSILERRGARMIELRPYQCDVIQAFDAEVDRGIRRLILVAPTGSGKTVILAEIVRKLARSSKRVMVLAHRREIIAQTSAKLLAADVVHGIIQAGFRPRPLELVQVASVQTCGCGPSIPR